MAAMHSLRNIRSREFGSYNQTPIGPYLSEEERKKLRENIPHGVHPRVTAKGHMATKSDYYVPVVPIPEGAVHPYDRENFATRLIAAVPKNKTLSVKRAYWEKKLLGAYYHLYGGRWHHWKTLLPWAKQADIPAKALDYQCEQPWNWTVKRRFLESHGFAWSLDDLNYLIDRYPDRQLNGHEQGIYVSDKTFEEIQKVAEALGLANREVLATLSDYAHTLYVG